MKKIYVNDTNQATIICPKCGFEKKVDVTDFKDTQKKLKAKCQCGETHRITIEFRKKYRKDVRLPGEYIIQGKGERGEIIIRELSLTGVRFESLKPHQISTDRSVHLTFLGRWILATYSFLSQSFRPHPHRHSGSVLL